MLHQIKRKVARVQQPLRGAGANAEFLSYKQRLGSIKSSLKYTSAMLDSANRGWILQMQQQRSFSERFHESYPSPGDDTYKVAAEFAEGSQELYDKFTRETCDDMAAYANIHAQVVAYINEIEEVESVYAKLADAKSEAARYQSKLDAMERSKKGPDDHKKSRNLAKMDDQKGTYKVLLADTVKAQKKTYSKHPVLFKAALTSYWLSHEKHVTLLVQSLEKTADFARQAEAEMKDLDITKLGLDEPLEGEAESPNSAATTPEGSLSPASVTGNFEGSKAAEPQAPDSASEKKQSVTSPQPWPAHEKVSAAGTVPVPELA